MTLTLTKTETTVSEWAVFPFTYLGKNYHSRVSTSSRMFAQIMALPEGVFANMNIQCLADIAKITESSTNEEIQAQLDDINNGGSYAFVELAN